MWSEILDVGTFRSRFDDVPDSFRCKVYAPYLPQSAYSAEEHPCSDTSCIGPLIDNALCPRRNWHGANVLSPANQVGDHPVLLTDLKIFQSQSNQFCASPTASDQERQNRSITLTSQAISLRFREQASGLFDGQPVSDPSAPPFCTFDATDSGCQFGTQKSCISCLMCESSYSR